MQTRFYLFLVFILCLNIISQAQSKFNQITVPFFNETGILTNALSGGLNSPKFSSIDLNNDQIEDLLVFDRVGNILLAYQNDGSNNYIFNPNLIKNIEFPFTEFVLAKDYDGDGIKDLFSYSLKKGVDGISVLKGSYDSEGIYQATIQKEFLTYPSLSNGNQVNLYLLKGDIPAIYDVDGDGDLDILTFDIAGSNVDYYKNLSIEKGNDLSGLDFKLENTCFGGLYESGQSEEITLASTKGDCASGIVNDDLPKRHAGSTLTGLDYNGDQLMDLMIGDISIPYLNVLINGGSPVESWYNDQILRFPPTISTEIDVFPAGYIVDINQDGIFDLITAPNERSAIENIETAWYYENQGNNFNPNFVLQTKSFINNTSIDLGTNSHPVFADIDGDGLQDLIIGSAGSYRKSDTPLSVLKYYKNIGTVANPSFELMDEDWLGFSEIEEPFYNLDPSFGDIDQDGDLDLFIGEGNGTILFFENTAGEGNSMNLSTMEKDYFGIDVGQSSSVSIFDLDEDGLEDLIIGERNGNLNFFKNLGSTGVPSFNSDQNMSPNSNFLGQINTRDIGSSTGNAIPIFYNDNGQTKLIIGKEGGKILHYAVNTADIYGKYQILAENLGDIKIGRMSHPTMCDLNQDGKLELLIGNERGGIQLFQSDFDSKYVGTEELLEAINVNIFPNPSKGTLSFQNGSIYNLNLKIFNVHGKEIIEKDFKKGSALSIQLKQKGIYFAHFISTNGNWVKKIVVQ